MRSRLVPAVLASVLMVSSSLAAWKMTPVIKMADSRARGAVDTVIPQQFGDWSVDKTVTPVLVANDVQARLNKIYDETLARTYRNSAGDRVMLSIAYGGMQTRTLQVHRPEVCYTQQGFRVSHLVKATLNAGSAELPVMRVLAQLGQRREPITYWVVLGDKVTRGNIEQGLTRLSYGLSGRIPDGLLVRVSSISADDEAAYKIQDRFIAELLTALPDDQRKRFVGL